MAWTCDLPCHGLEIALFYAFSKKRIYLEAAVALFMAFYNFCRVHSTTRVTPAMASGLTSTVWSLADLLTADTQEQIAA